MVSRVWIVAAAGLVALAGCSFESSDGGASAGLGDSSGGSSEGSDSDPTGNDTTTGSSASGTSQGTGTTDDTDPTGASDPTVDPTEDPTDTTDPTSTTGDTETSDTADPTTGDESSSTSGVEDPAVIEIAGTEFGDITYLTPEDTGYTITNVGGEPATSLDVAVSGPFSLQSNGCPEMLAPDEDCEVSIRHDANVLGPFSGTLDVTFDGGMANAALEVDVLGSTANLIEDPGFEFCPDGVWDNVGAGSWVCGADWATPHGGSTFLSANTGPSNQDFVLRQDLDVSEYANAIATGAMEFEFRGWARAFQSDDDDYRIRVRYRDGGGTVLETYNTGYQTSDNWVERVDARDAPATTEEIRIELFCRKSGGTYCDAYYDDFVLVGTYSGS